MGEFDVIPDYIFITIDGMFVLIIEGSVSYRNINREADNDINRSGAEAGTYSSKKHVNIKLLMFKCPSHLQWGYFCNILKLISKIDNLWRFSTHERKEMRIDFFARKGLIWLSLLIEIS